VTPERGGEPGYNAGKTLQGRGIPSKQAVKCGFYGSMRREPGTRQTHRGLEAPGVPHGYRVRFELPEVQDAPGGLRLVLGVWRWIKPGTLAGVGTVHPGLGMHGGLSPLGCQCFSGFSQALHGT
jgi:hypothetical protein